MFDKPIKTFEDEIVETRKRTIHEFTHTEARISAWHGDGHVADFTTFNCLKPAIESAEQLCKRYDMTPKSTMFLRIEQSETRNFKTLLRDGKWPEYELKAPYPDRTIMRRQVWDSRSGLLPSNPGLADVDLIIPIGMNPEMDPGPILPTIVSNIEVEVSSATLLSGLGIGALTITKRNRVDLNSPPSDIHRSEKNHKRWAAIHLQGTLCLQTPPQLSHDEINAILADEIRLSPRMDWNSFSRLANQLSIFTGNIRERIDYPAALDVDAQIAMEPK